jgi:hypothetical protein
MHREALLTTHDQIRTQRGDFRRGLVLCVASGISSPMINLSLAFGDPISSEASRWGADHANASIAVLAVAVSAGFFINSGYCVFLMRRDGSNLFPRFSACVICCSCNGFLGCLDYTLRPVPPGWAPTVRARLAGIYDHNGSYR